jgi:hypothetical protein
MALGSSCFGLLFPGSGSTFGSTSPPLSGRAILPLYPSSFFWVANPKMHRLVPPRHSPGQTKESLRTPVSDCRLLPSRRPPSDQHRDLGPGTASREEPNNLAPFPTGGYETEFEFRRRGTTFSEFPTDGFVRWQTRERRSPTALAGRWFPSDWEGKHSRNFRQLPRRAVSDFLLQ